MKTKLKMTVAAVIIGSLALAGCEASYAEGYVSRQEAVDYLAQNTPTLPVLPTSPAQLLPPNAPPFNTNGLDFTNVTFKVALGYRTIDGGGSVGFAQADADLWHLKNLDLGFSGNASFGAFNEGLYSAAIDFAVFKNLANFQLVGKAGVGWNFEQNVGGYGEVGVDLNYNLTQATGWTMFGAGSAGWFTYIGAGIGVQAYKFQINANASNLNKYGWLGAGVAF